MLNDQLQCHLDEFAAEPNETDDEEERGSLNSQAAAISDNNAKLFAGTKVKRFFTRIGGNSGGENIFTILTLLPLFVAVALSGDIGLHSCLFFASLGMLYRNIEPLEASNSKDDATTVDTYHQPSQDQSAMSAKSTDYLQRSRETEASNLKNLSSCRLRVTTMLGLVGAPPLDNFQGFLEARHLSFDQDKENSSSPVLISESVIRSIVDFAQAHVDLLLSLDQAYYWLQVTSSVHMGLGPMASCVERVERAALAREYREINTGKAQRDVSHRIVREDSLEPQKTVGKSKVIALANVRKTLAQVIVNESRSLSGVISANRDKSGQSGPGPNDDGMIDLPEITSLAWIKSSRHQLASTLSHVLQKLCELKSLQLLSLSPRSPGEYDFDDSTSFARELKAYIVSKILLDNSDISNRRFDDLSLVMEYPAMPNSLENSLVQLREHLDALRGSLWACRHTYGPKTSVPVNSNQNLNQDQTEWWAQSQKLSRAVRAIEEEINDKFFQPAEPSDIVDASMLNSSLAQSRRADSGNYEHSNSPDTSTSTPYVSEHVQPKKTLVFSGHGTISDQPKTILRHGKESSAAPMQRDAIAEHLLVKELQNRICMINPPAEVELRATDGVKVDPGRSPKVNTNATVTSHFLGATGPLLSELKNSLPPDLSQQWKAEN